MKKTMWIRQYAAPKVKSIEGFSPREEMAQRDVSGEARAHRGWKLCYVNHDRARTKAENVKAFRANQREREYGQAKWR